MYPASGVSAIPHLSNRLPSRPTWLTREGASPRPRGGKPAPCGSSAFRSCGGVASLCDTGRHAGRDRRRPSARPRRDPARARGRRRLRDRRRDAVGDAGAAARRADEARPRAPRRAHAAHGRARVPRRDPAAAPRDQGRDALGVDEPGARRGGAAPRRVGLHRQDRQPRRPPGDATPGARGQRPHRSASTRSARARRRSASPSASSRSSARSPAGSRTTRSRRSSGSRRRR